MTTTAPIPTQEVAMSQPTRQCTICGRPADAPYRRLVAGVVVEGCVAAIHGELDGWAARPAARQLRADAILRAHRIGLPVDCPAVTG